MLERTLAKLLRDYVVLKSCSVVCACLCIGGSRMCQVTLLRKHRRQNVRTKDRGWKMFERTNRRERARERELKKDEERRRRAKAKAKQR